MTELRNTQVTVLEHGKMRQVGIGGVAAVPVGVGAVRTRIWPLYTAVTIVARLPPAHGARIVVVMHTQVPGRFVRTMVTWCTHIAPSTIIFNIVA